MNIRAHSPVWGNANRTTINLMIAVDCLPGEVGFTAAPYDVEGHGCELYERAINGEFGKISDYVIPTKTPMQLAMIEDQWRVAELNVIADQLIALEDGDPSALAITEGNWREYRTAVRGWKEGANFFPDIAHRPLRPR